MQSQGKKVLRVQSNRFIILIPYYAYSETEGNLLTYLYMGYIFSLAWFIVLSNTKPSSTRLILESYIDRNEQEVTQMADKGHFFLLMKGAVPWNQWRQEHTEVQPDLCGVDLTNANLRGADLTKADLRWTDLTKADLTEANLTEAFLTEANLIMTNLSKANLTKADLLRASLFGADLRGAVLRKADLTEADLYEADLRGADLREANLYRADFRRADLRETNYIKANFYGTKLIGAIFSDADVVHKDG